MIRLIRRFCTRPEDPVISYLYVGRRGNTTPFTVEPNLDFRDRFEKIDQLKSIIDNRKFKLSMDVDRLAAEYSKCFLVLRRHRSLMSELSIVKNQQKDTAAEEKIKSIKSEIKSINFNADVENILLECLKLPNDLSVDTPTGDRSILADRYESEDQRRNIDHNYFLIDRDLCDLRKNPDRLYMTGDAAALYYRLEDLIRYRFDRLNYRLISPSHFLRKSIAEASEVIFADNRYLQVESVIGADGRDTVWGLNISGHGLGVYLALLVEKRLSENNRLPLIFCSLGMSYKLIDKKSKPNRFFSEHFQRPVATIFVSAQSDQELIIVEKQLITDIESILRSIDINWNRFLTSSELLQPSEMKRFDWITESGSDSQGDRLASISIYGDFLSKRLRCTCKLPNNSWTYLHMAYVEIDLYTLLGAVIDRYVDEKSQTIDLNLIADKFSQL